MPDALALRGMALARLGRKTEAQAVLEELDALSQRRYVSPFHWALVHMSLGDQERTLDLLEQLSKDHGWFVRLLRVEPGFDALRSHPRFTKLLVKVRLDEWPKLPK